MVKSVPAIVASVSVVVPFMAVKLGIPTVVEELVADVVTAVTEEVEDIM